MSDVVTVVSDMFINSTAIKMHQIAVDKGWYNPPKSLGEALLLMHAELSEAAEELRKFGSEVCIKDVGKLTGADHAILGPITVYYNADKPGKPEGFGVELADCVIRIMDTCEHLGIDLEAMICLKSEYNKTRPQRHGSKTL